MLFFRVENFHFGGPKTNLSRFKKWQEKKKKKGPLLILELFPPSIFNYQFFTFPFKIFLHPPPFFHFFPCLFFPGESAEISRSEVSGLWGHSAPCPPPVTPLHSLYLYDTQGALFWGLPYSWYWCYYIWITLEIFVFYIQKFSYDGFLGMA